MGRKQIKQTMMDDSAFEYEMKVKDARNDIIPFLQGVWVNLHQEWGDDAIHTQSIQQAIWKASTEMLPHLERTFHPVQQDM